MQKEHMYLVGYLRDITLINKYLNNWIKTKKCKVMVQPVVIYGSVSCWYHKNRTDDLDRWDDHIDIYTREIFLGQNTKLGNNSNAIAKALWML